VVFFEFIVLYRRSLYNCGDDIGGILYLHTPKHLKSNKKMPFIKVYIHFVWSTKNREPLLDSPELRKQVWKHIRDNGKEKNIFIDFVNGYKDHCHCLISLGVDQTIQKVMQLIKGETSFWINKSNLTKQRF